MPDEPKSSRKRLLLRRRDPDRPGALDRGRMRRRMRRQRQVREALLLDLGALVFELHRQGRREPELLQAKAAELSEVDEEVRALSDALEGRGTDFQLSAAGELESEPQTKATEPGATDPGATDAGATDAGATDPGAKPPAEHHATPPWPPVEASEAASQKRPGRARAWLRRRRG
ncbi:MAG: hypothetical protein M3433_03560 [Actinomycetota bacterium]|nr:hypothetical protein [Actinomycetota bacterium]